MSLTILLGPLLYHFADMPHEMSIELSWEDVRQIIVKTGFEILVCTNSRRVHIVMHAHMCVISMLNTHGFKYSVLC